MKAVFNKIAKLFKREDLRSIVSFVYTKFGVLVFFRSFCAWKIYESTGQLVKNKTIDEANLMILFGAVVYTY